MYLIIFYEYNKKLEYLLAFKLDLNVNLLYTSYMKRKNNLYKNICYIENIMQTYKEIIRKTKNKKKKAQLNAYKSIYINRVYRTLNDKSYIIGEYNQFKIYEPKERIIYSQKIEDKIINQLVAKYILYPSLLPCFIDANVAARKRLGLKKGLILSNTFHHKCKINFQKYYILKCDISKFFLSIDHNILKQKILKRIKDKDALEIVFDIIDSNHKGLYIGSMTSQILATFYLNDMDHFIKEKLKIKYYVRFQDDFLLFHPSKKYLQYCLKEISQFLKIEKLTLNKKTRIYKNTNNFVFLGRNNHGDYAKYRTVRRRLKFRKYKYTNSHIKLYNYTLSILSYKNLCKKNFKFKNGT